jgi:hypothetical protein
VLIIYCPHITSRLRYIASTLLGNHVLILDDKENYLQNPSEKLNYSATRIADNEVWMKPHGLLDETNIKSQTIDCFEWNGLKAFFKTDGDIPFDFLSASFYLLSRYEEYLPHELDSYGRYAHENSIAYKQSFLNLPLVNLWLREIAKLFPQSHFPFSTINFLPTYDIDIAYCYKQHLMVKKVFGFFRDFLKGNLEKVTERAGVYSGMKKDPFDIYDWLDDLHKKHQLKANYFFLVAQERKGYDKNLSPKTKAMQQLMKSHAAKYAVGVHPSWQSGDDSTLLSEEKQIVEKATGKAITRSRQHYIRMELPKTYRLLLKNNIKDDYSMGYGSINGFRASYTLPFKWYDLQNEQETNLTIHPFCYMEANSYFEQKMTPTQAEDELQHYYDVVKNVNGQLITIFHNHFLTEQPEWVSWRRMYEHFLQRNFG